jgi:hypothetical protein
VATPLFSFPKGNENANESVLPHQEKSACFASGFFNEARLAAREVVLRTVKLLRSVVCSASVWAHFTSLLRSKYFTMATAITSLGASQTSRKKQPPVLEAAFLM